MFKSKLVWLWLMLTVLFCLALVLFNLKHGTSGYLSFSDSAKFAEIARNINNGDGFVAMFSFFGGDGFWPLSKTFFSARGVSVLTPFVISLFYSVMGVNDFAVISTSLFFFCLILILTFLLSYKIYNNITVSILSALAVGTNYDLINYARMGASESPFVFEIIAILYFFSLQKKWANILGFIFIIIIYLTRPQAFIYIIGAILFWLLKNLQISKALIWFFFLLLFSIFVDKYVLANLPENLFLISILDRGGKSLTYYIQDSSISDPLRGVKNITYFVDIMKKIFYNLYNFYKLLPQIINPYMFALFAVGLFTFSSKTSKGQTNTLNTFKIATLFMVLVTLLVTAASIPFFRYIHPIIPLVYIIAVGTLVQIINLQFTIGQNHSVGNQFTILNLKISKQVLVNLVSTFLILFFAVGQTLGIIFLDSRFEKKSHNTDKPPVYVVLSQILKDNTNKDDVVITNLDTWGSWYGERKTVWYPLEPKLLSDPTTGKIPFDAIYLTSYLIDDQNYYMGESWRMIFDNPKDTSKWTCDGCDKIANEFEVENTFETKAEDVYEKNNYKAILFIKK